MRTLIKATEAAEILDLGVPAVYTLARAGVLPSVSIGRHLRFDPDRLAEWIQAGGDKTPPRAGEPGPRRRTRTERGGRR